MPMEKSPPPSTARLTKVDTAPSRVKPDPSIAQVMPPQSASLPPPKPPTVFTAKEALTRSSVLVDQIPAVVEQMKFHKKQARRLAELASFVFDAIDSSIPKPPPEDTGGFVSEGLEKLIRCAGSLRVAHFCSLLFRVLYRIEERLRDIGSGNLVTRMNELPFVQHDLTELEDECVEVAQIFWANSRSSRRKVRKLIASRSRLAPPSTSNALTRQKTRTSSP
jgi:hypothetical protein